MGPADMARTLAPSAAVTEGPEGRGVMEAQAGRAGRADMAGRAAPEATTAEAMDRVGPGDMAPVDRGGRALEDHRGAGARR
jgi:hypothetical protein